MGNRTERVRSIISNVWPLGFLPVKLVQIHRLTVAPGLTPSPGARKLLEVDETVRVVLDRY